MIEQRDDRASYRAMIEQRDDRAEGQRDDRASYPTY